MVSRFSFLSLLLWIFLNGAWSQIPVQSLVSLSRERIHPPETVVGKALIFIPAKEEMKTKDPGGKDNGKTPFVVEMDAHQKQGYLRILSEGRDWGAQVLRESADFRSPPPVQLVKKQSPKIVEMKKSPTPAPAPKAKSPKPPIKVPVFKETNLIPKAVKEIDPRYLPSPSPFIRKISNGEGKEYVAAQASGKREIIPGSLNTDHYVRTEDPMSKVSLTRTEKNERSNQNKKAYPRADYPADSILKPGSSSFQEGKDFEESMEESTYRKRALANGNDPVLGMIRPYDKDWNRVRHSQVELNPLLDIRPDHPVLGQKRITPARFMDLPEGVFQEAQIPPNPPEIFEAGYRGEKGQSYQFRKDESTKRSVNAQEFRKRTSSFRRRRRVQQGHLSPVGNPQRDVQVRRRKDRRPLGLF